MLVLLQLTEVSAFRRMPGSNLSSPEQQEHYYYHHHHQEQQQHRRTAGRSPVTVPIPNSPDEHLVTDLPLLDADDAIYLTHWAGHLPVQAGDKYLFYWLFAPPADTAAVANAPLLIWLNGGPACSSMDGLFLENGPIQWAQDQSTGKYKLQRNPYSWHLAPAYTLYIDQPVGTGLSFTTSGTYPRNDEQVNQDFYTFLQSFFAVHADKFVTDGKVNRDVYFSGESHAGHYIPSMMNYILQQNDANRNTDKIQIPLAGAAIGNGWIDPFHQYAAAQAAYGHGLVDLGQLYQFDAQEKQCQAALDRRQYTASVCFALLDDVVGQSYGSSSNYKVSQYDIRRSEQKHGARDFPPGYKITDAYLGGWPLTGAEGDKLDVSMKESVLAAIHASAATTAGQRYQECTDPPYHALEHQDGLGVVDDVVDILNHASRPKMLFFNGIYDLICNHVGNEKALEYLPWQYQKEWMKATRYAWAPNGLSAPPSSDRPPVAGYMREYQNLMYLKLFDSGHMVPLDIPDVALAMMQNLMQGKSFDSSKQALQSAADPPDGPSCPTCPTCPAAAPTNDDCPICPSSTDDDDDDDDEFGSDDDNDTGKQALTGEKVLSWLGPLLAVAGVLALAYSCWPKRRRRGKAIQRDAGDLALSPMNGRTSSSRSLELHERQSFHDRSGYHDELEDKELT